MGCFNSKGEKDDNGSKGPNSTKGSIKKPILTDEAGYAKAPPPPPGIMDSSNSEGNKKGLAYHAGYATKYDYEDNNGGSEGPNSTNGRTKKPNLADAAGYAMTSPPST